MHSSLASRRKVLPRTKTFTCGEKGGPVKNWGRTTCRWGHRLVPSPELLNTGLGLFVSTGYWGNFLDFLPLGPCDPLLFRVLLSGPGKQREPGGLNHQFIRGGPAPWPGPALIRF